MSISFSYLSSSSLPRTTTGDDSGGMHFEDSASAAKAAAKCANDAMAAAKAAAFLANKDLNQAPSQAPSFDHKLNSSSVTIGFETTSVGSSTDRAVPDGPPVDSQYMDQQYKSPGTRTFQSQSFNESRSHYPGNVRTSLNNSMDSGKMHRRHSYNAPSAHSDMKSDELDCDGEFEAESPSGGFGILPPERPPPPVPSSQVLKQNSAPRVHPKLPDYDSLAARFEALKYRKSKT